MKRGERTHDGFLVVNDPEPVENRPLSETWRSYDPTPPDACQGCRRRPHQNGAGIVDEHDVFVGGQWVVQRLCLSCYQQWRQRHERGVAGALWRMATGRR